MFHLACSACAVVVLLSPKQNVHVCLAAVQNSVLLASFYLLGMGVVCNWVALMQCLDYLGTIFRVRAVTCG